MISQEEVCPIASLPGELLFEVQSVIHGFSTALIMVTTGSDGKESARLIGSGTFISISGRVGILTAAHVTDLLRGSYSLGLTLTERVHKYTMESEYLEVMRIAKGLVDSEGPDLAFIALPPAKLGTIQASKTFHNLDRNHQRMLDAPPDFDMGVWALCGVPDVETTEEIPEKGFESLKGFRGYCGFGGIRSTYAAGEYDYCDFEVKHDSSPNIPTSFGGFSGGGLWQIPLLKLPEGKISPKEYILSGVAFYQTERAGLYRSVKCHGRKSIYDVFYKAMVPTNS